MLQDFATKIVGYPVDRPAPFSWPVQAGFTNSGPAIRARVSYDFWKYFMKNGRRNLEAYNKANNKEIRISREKTKLLQEHESLGLYIRKRIREASQKAGVPVDVTIVKGLMRIGAEQPMKPTTAAIKLNIDMSQWNGSSLEELLSPQERNDIKNGRLVYGSLVLKGITVSSEVAARELEGSTVMPHVEQPTTSENMSPPIGPNSPKRKRTLADFMRTKN